ncbi:hypothetical protein evm_006863 [Chilo suppressalis]|nr:hypothetical protein evm_006863 [Chilo suppressalis]
MWSITQYKTAPPRSLPLHLAQLHSWAECNSPPSAALLHLVTHLTKNNHEAVSAVRGPFRIGHGGHDACRGSKRLTSKPEITDVGRPQRYDDECSAMDSFRRQYYHFLQI